MNWLDPGDPDIQWNQSLLDLGRWSAGPGRPGVGNARSDPTAQRDG